MSIVSDYRVAVLRAAHDAPMVVHDVLDAVLRPPAE